MSDDQTCPHCHHPWKDHYGSYCHCGCMWGKPEPPKSPPARPTVEGILCDALWAGFEASDNCYADSAMDIIDTSGNYESFDISQVVYVALRVLAEHGYRIICDTPE